MKYTKEEIENIVKQITENVNQNTGEDFKNLLTKINSEQQTALQLEDIFTALYSLSQRNTMLIVSESLNRILND